MDMVEERIAAGAADAANLAALIAESLVEVILRSPRMSRRSSWRIPWRSWATRFLRGAALTGSPLARRDVRLSLWPRLVSRLPVRWDRPRATEPIAALLGGHP